MPQLRVILTLILLIFSVVILHAQKLLGTVYDEKGNLLPFSTITVKGTSSGVTANNKAQYSFQLKQGSYTIICQHIGYEALEKTITISGETQLDFILKVQYLNLKEFVVDNKGENPAYEIIRQAIKKRNYYNSQVKGFSCDLYGKDMIKLRSLPKRVMGQKVEEEDRQSMGVDSTGKGIIYLSESVSKLAVEQPNKYKLEVVSSRVSGSNSFGFTFPAFINMYQNNVTVFDQGFNKRGFVSPIADGALRFYKYKILGTFFENGKMINTIRVTPKRKYEPLFSGIINIVDEVWRIHSFELEVTKENQLEVLDTIKITQLYVPVSKDVWMVKNQLMYFNFKKFGIDVIGNFLSVYSDYSINPVFSKKYFDRVLIKYDTAVNKKTRSYWDTIRPVPLETEELHDYKVKDSIFQSELDSQAVRNNIDTLRKKQGKLKITNLVFPGISRTCYRKQGNIYWGTESLLNNLQYNTAEGINLQLSAYIRRRIGKNKALLTVQPSFRYGFSNHHFNSWATVTFARKDTSAGDDTKNTIWDFSGGKRVSQYNKNQPILPITNTVSSLQSGKNYMKTYENIYANVVFSQFFDNGLKFSVQALYEDRLPLYNTTNFIFNKKDSINLTENFPTDRVAARDVFRYQAFNASFRIVYRPGQKYIQLPKGRIPLGSKFPELSFTYTKGIKGFLGSDVDFDKWRFSVSDDKNLKLAGTMKYRFATGGFFNSKKVFIHDYHHFMANGLKSASEYVKSFQLTSSYEHSTTAPFYITGNIEHHFNGLLTNKIPFFKKLNWNLVAGTNGIYVDKNNNFIEGFVGLENIFKFIRIDYVSALDNGKTRRNAIVIGADGLLGSVLNTAFRSDSQDYINRIGF